MRGCGSSRVIHDPRRHGFDGAVGNNVSFPAPRGVPRILEADDVESPYELFVRLEYPNDTLTSHPQFAGREAELYSWVTLVGFVDCIGRRATLFDSECA